MSKLKLFGVPYSVGTRTETSHGINQQDGPDAIRTALNQLLRGYNIDLPFEDIGDIVSKNDVTSVLTAVEEKVREIRTGDNIPIVLGGAHTLTYGSLTAIKETEAAASLVYFDAHPDLMPRDEVDYGSSLYHAVDSGLIDPQEIALLGIRQIEDEEKDFIDKHDITYFTPADFERLGCEEIISQVKNSLSHPLFFSIDLDAIDPAFAPGVTSPYPIGLTPREVLTVASALTRDCDVLGIEVVELSPVRDASHPTANVAAAMIVELGRIVAGK